MIKFEKLKVGDVVVDGWEDLPVYELVLEILEPTFDEYTQEFKRFFKTYSFESGKIGVYNMNWVHYYYSNISQIFQDFPRGQK